MSKKSAVEPIDLTIFGLSERIEKLIIEGKPKGERSEAIMSAVVGLVAAGATDDQIFGIFEKHPIGEKYMEVGASRREWLQKQIDKAREYIVKNNVRPEVPPKEILNALDDGERGEAALFVKYFNGKLCYDHWARQWYNWKGHWEEDKIEQSLTELDWLVSLYANEAERQHRFWRKARDEEKESEAKRALMLEKSLLDAKKRIQCLQRRRNILVFSSSGWDSLGIEGGKWDSDPLLLPCQNGVIDLRDGSFRDAKPHDYIKTIARAAWNGIDEPAPTWERFLNQVFQSDAEMIEFVQRLLGYSSSGLATEHILPICWGQGRNGKGVLMLAIAHVLGQLADPIPSETLLDQSIARNGSSHTADLMILKGRRIVWASEVGENRRFDAAKVKWLVGGDKIVARPPFGKGFITFDPTHTLFVLTNHKPAAPADDYAFWQRVLLIHFGVSFVDHPRKPNEMKRDPEILNRLKAESAGILAWLVRGFLQWRERGLNPPRQVFEKTSQYQMEEDIIGAFMNECCTISNDQRVRANDLYQAYQEWCKDNGHRPLSNTRFGKKMSEKFEKRTSNGNWYIGITIKGEEPTRIPETHSKSHATSDEQKDSSLKDFIEEMDEFIIS